MPPALSLQVMEGSLRVGMPDERMELTAGMLLALESDIPHDIEASTDSVFLLTIGRTTYEHVSDLHEPGR
jgi:quercetin dioxygenase-like cupin family protein